MTATLLSTAATIHAAKLYSPSGTPTADLVRIHAERRAYVGLILSALLEGDDTQRLPNFNAGPYSDRYRHELNFRGEAFGDDVAAEWLYRNVLIEEKAHAHC